MPLRSLREIHQIYVVERRPLETSLEEILRADSRPGARAILATIEKRRFESRSEGYSDFARCFASKQIFGKMDTMPSPVSMKLA
jgi:hypothetical protein